MRCVKFQDWFPPCKKRGTNGKFSGAATGLYPDAFRVNALAALAQAATTGP